MPTPANVRLSTDVLTDLAQAVSYHRQHADRISLVTLDDYSIEDDVVVGASFTISFDGAADSAIILGEL